MGEADASGGDPTDLFWARKSRLLGLAYRMLGDRDAAEDVVQETYLRWREVAHGDVRDPDGYLTRVAARLAIDALRARRRREAYPGPWLPEPVVDADHDRWGLGENLSSALMVALERLSPLERAVFLLHDIFEQDFAEIAETLERTPEACRQLASRARRHVGQDKPRFTVDPGEGERLAEAFFLASRQGDVAALGRLLAEDAVLLTDGGGVRPAALLPILGREKIIRFCVGLARKEGAGIPPRMEGRCFTGSPGFMTRESDGLPQVVSLDIREGRIAAVHVLRNPVKLRRLWDWSGRTASNITPRD